MAAEVIDSTPISNLRIAILGHNLGLADPWDPSATKTGLPGSEEAVVYATDELAARGHQVTIYMNPPPDSSWSTPSSNPRWLHVTEWQNRANQARYDLVLMWRRFDFYTGKARGKIVFHWPHDSPGFRGGPIPLKGFDGLLLLSQHHWNQYQTQVIDRRHGRNQAIPLFIGYETIPRIIAGNGALLEHFPSPMTITNPYSLGYFSNYARGLANLLQLWPQIRKMFPQATLSICYGREHWGTCPPAIFDFIIKSIAKFQDAGVIEYGKVGHLRLAEIMSQTSIWAYPCGPVGITETFCITAVKAQLAGMIPVTTRVGALQETIHPDAPSIPQLQTEPELRSYEQLLLQTLDRIRSSDPEVIRAEREKYIAFAKQFSWAACVQKWLQLYTQIHTDSS